MTISPNLETVLTHLTTLSQVEANGDPERHLFARAVAEVRDLARAVELADRIVVAQLDTGLPEKDYDKAFNDFGAFREDMRAKYGTE